MGLELRIGKIMIKKINKWKTYKNKIIKIWIDGGGIWW